MDTNKNNREKSTPCRCSLFICNPSSTDDSSSSSKFTEASGTSVDLPNTHQQSSSSHVQDGDKQQNMLPFPKNSDESNNQVTGDNRRATELQKKEKEFSLENVPTEPSKRVPVGDGEITKRDKCVASSQTSMAAKHRPLSISPYRSSVRRRRQSGNRSQDRKSRHLNETSDEDVKQPTLLTRGRDGGRREETSRELDSEHVRDHLHQRLQNLESRFSDMDSVAKNMHAMLRRVLSTPVLQDSLKSVQGEHRNDAPVPLNEDSPHKKQPEAYQERYTKQPKGGNQQTTKLDVNHQQPMSQTHAQGHLPRPETQQSLLQQPKQQQQQPEDQSQEQENHDLNQHIQSTGLKSLSPHVGVCGGRRYELKLDSGSFRMKPQNEPGNSGCGRIGNEVEDKIMNLKCTASKMGNSQDLAAGQMFQGQSDYKRACVTCQPPTVNDKLMEERSREYDKSDSSNSSDAIRQACTLTDWDIPKETKSRSLQACLQWITSSNTKMDAVSERLDKVLALLQSECVDDAYLADPDRTELKTVRHTSQERHILSQDPNNSTTKQLLSEMRETLQTSVEASLRMQSIWTVAQVSDMQETMTKMVQNMFQVHHASTSEVLGKVEELRRCHQQNTLLNQATINELQTQRSVFGEKLEDLEQTLTNSDGKVDQFFETFSQEIGNVRHLISTEIDRKMKEINFDMASHANIMQDKISELNKRFTCTLDDINNGFKSCKSETKEDIHAIHAYLETKFNTSEIIFNKTKDELNANRAKDAEELKDIRDQLETKVWNTLQTIAGRLDKTKLELFSMVEKENQLVRDLIYEQPTRDHPVHSPRRNFTFDLYIDKFVQRMAAAAQNQVNEIPTAVNGIIPNLDTYVHSMPWNIPFPVDTSFQGFVKFTNERTIKVYLLFGRNPNEMGLFPRVGRAMSCCVSVTDLSGEQEDIELNSARNQRGQGDSPTRGEPVIWRPWNETEIKTNEKTGLFLGTVSCRDILDRRLNTSYADGSVLLRYIITVS